MRLRSYPGKPVSRQAQNLLFDVYFKYGFNILITVQILNAFGRFLLVTSDIFLIQYSNLVRNVYRHIITSIQVFIYFVNLIIHYVHYFFSIFILL